MRTYTLSSSPSRPFSIAVTVKAQAGSIGTRWMFDNLMPGSHVKAYGPAGDFSLHSHPAAKYLFISAGSGVTPMMSMLRWLNDCAPWTDVGFVNCARRPEEIIFRKELELLGGHMPGLSLGFMIEERSSREGWYGHMGRIDAIRAAAAGAGFPRARDLLLRPRSVHARRARHAGCRRLRHDEIPSGELCRAVVEEIPAPFASPAEDGTAVPVEAVTPIRFSLSEVDADCVAGQTVLQTARSSGVRIPAACEFGLCGTCKVKKVSGDVEMSHNGGILDHEIDDGFILACCSKPLSALEIEA